MHRYCVQVIRSIMLLAIPLVSLHGQRTASSNDAPRTLFGVSFGLLQGGLLWDVLDQPITPITPAPDKTPFAPDIWELRRELVPARPVVEAHITHFINEHVGFTAGFAMYSLKTRDVCTVVYHPTGIDGGQPGDPALRAICDAVPGTGQGAQASSGFQGGVIVRGGAHAVVQPFVTAQVGILSMPASTAALRSDYAGSSLSIYRDPGWSSSQPTWLLGIGVATQAVPGLQAHIEARESWIAQATVTGASAGQASNTPVSNKFRGLFQVLVGFDMVLSRERGKRY
jgi:hypothetical protein